LTLNDLACYNMKRKREVGEMKYKFLPKALDGIGGARACLDIGRGVASTEPHFHDCAEIVYMKRGSMRVFLDLEWMTLEEGETLFVPPGVIHSTDCKDPLSHQYH